MSTELRVSLAKSATARAHLAGAEAAELVEKAYEHTNGRFVPMDLFGEALEKARAARRRYWRDVAAVQRLIGQPWPEAEALGTEP